MKFLPKEICEELVEMGCKSESRDFYYGTNDFTHNIDSILFQLSEKVLLVKAFCLEDFVGTHEQAKENCKIIWPGPKHEYFRNENGYSLRSGQEKIDECIYCGQDWIHQISTFKYHRYGMIDSKDWVAFVTPYIESAYARTKNKNS